MALAIRKSDFNVICRTCLLVKSDMLSIHSLEVPKMLLSCTGLKIEENDSLPKLICIDCDKLIRTSFGFKELCLKSEKTLREVLEYDDVNVSNVQSECVSNGKFKSDDSCDGELKADNDIAEFLNDNEEDYTDSDERNGDGDDASDNRTQTRVGNQTRRIEIQDSDDDSDLISCKICSKKIRESTLQGHMRRHKQPRKHTCDKCSKAYREPNELAKHRARVHHLKESVTCEVCKKVFQIQAQLDFHMKRHFKKKSVCDICGKVYFNSAKLKRHKYVHENREKTIFCLQCDRMFARESSLIIHNRNYHSGKPLAKKICNICGKSVLNIKTHTLQRHSSERPFQCEKCDKAFAIKYQLFKHVKEKHEEKPKTYNALCSTCGKCCKSVADLKVHMLSHTDVQSFACHMCEKKYKSSQGLKCHIRKHSDLRPYVCTFCPKGFYTSQILKNHLRTHTGERPYACKLCGRAFTQNCALKTHMKVHGMLQPNSASNSNFPMKIEMKT